MVEACRTWHVQQDSGGVSARQSQHESVSVPIRWDPCVGALESGTRPIPGALNGGHVGAWAAGLGGVRGGGQVTGALPGARGADTQERVGVLVPLSLPHRLVLTCRPLLDFLLSRPGQVRAGKARVGALWPLQMGPHGALRSS